MNNEEFQLEMEKENERIQNLELLSEIKEEYEDVYSLMINEYEFIYTLIGAKDYLEIVKMYEDPFSVREVICKKCVISPIVEDWNNDIYAGFVETVAEEILNNSLVETVDIKGLNMVYRREKHQTDNSLMFQIPLIINRAFNYKSIEEVERWNIPKQLRWLAKASWVLETYENKEEIKIEEVE